MVHAPILKRRRHMESRKPRSAQFIQSPPPNQPLERTPPCCSTAPLNGALDGMTSFAKSFEDDGYLVIGDAMSELDMVEIESNR